MISAQEFRNRARWLSQFSHVVPSVGGKVEQWPSLAAPRRAVPGLAALDRGGIARERDAHPAIRPRDGLAEDAGIDRGFGIGLRQRVGKAGDREIARVAVGKQHRARARVRNLDRGDRQL